IAVKPLITCLGSPHREVREEALSALKELVAPDDLPQLLLELEQPNPHTQLNILILLRKIHDVQALPYILPFFTSERPELREAAITTLRYLNQVERCQPALALMQDPDVTVVRATTLTLGHLQDAEVIPILQAALTSHSDWQVRRNAAQSLALHQDPGTIPALGQALGDDHWQVRKFAAQALQKGANQEVLPSLVRALSDEYSDVRKEAAIALRHFGDPQVLNALQQTLDDPDIEVRIQTERAIKQIQAATQGASNV
ncbi:MAG: HEAT repeat domain-containing protein, partial [Thermostichales cyanobacterium DRC_bins_46]